MTNKEQVIAQTRDKKSVNEAGKKRTKKQKENRGVEASFLAFEKVSVLENQDELFSLVKNLAGKYSNKDEDMKRTVNKKSDSVVYEMMEKNLCLSIARHVVKAFKHHHPKMEIHNPEDNIFYRITIRFEG